jgi:hypothetical protein
MAVGSHFSLGPGDQFKGFGRQRAKGKSLYLGE